MTTESNTNAENATEVKAAKIEAGIATEGLIDDEAQDGTDAEDQEGIDEGLHCQQVIPHEEIMSQCEEKINAGDDQELKNLFNANKKFYAGASCEEAKKAIATKVHNLVFKQ